MVKIISDKNYLFLFIKLFILIITAFTVSCSYDKGIIVTGSGFEKKGYVRFSECYDSYAGEKDRGTIEFKNSLISGWETIDPEDVSTLRRDGDTFIFIDSKKISGFHGADVKIPVQRIVDGRVSIYGYCSVKYNSTMFSSNRMDLKIYIISEKDKDSFYTIPHEPQQFKDFAAEHFASCPELVEEIKNKKFMKKIENPIPGNITEYEFVDEKDITGFVQRFNGCDESK